MDIARLNDLIKGALGPDQSLSLSTSLLSSAPLDRISEDFLPDNTLRLSEATIAEPPNGQSIVVHGKGVDLPFQAMDCELVFFLQADGGLPEVALRLTATGAAGWNLPTGFPPFEESLASAIVFSTSPKPTLELRSHTDQDGKAAGMSFTGNVDLSAMSGGLFALLGPLSQRLSGPVLLKENGSLLYAIDLRAQPVHEINLGIVTVADLSFRVRTSIDYDPSEETYYAMPYVELSGNILFSAEHPSVPVSVQIFDLDSDIRFSADLTSEINFALHDLEIFMNRVNFAHILPGQNFGLATALKLSELSFDSNLANRQVTRICARVENATNWSIRHPGSNQELLVKNVVLNFVVFDPFGSQATKSVDLSGEVELGKAGTLVINSRFPAWVIHGHLKEGTILNLTELVAQFLGPGVSVPELDLELLDFELSSEGYSLAATLDGVWDIGSTLSLDDISFEITSTDEEGTNASVMASLELAGVQLDLSADQPTDGRGWQFEGSTGSDQNIPIGALIDELAREFGHVTLPAAISDLTVENLGVSFDTKTKNFTFTCEAKIPVEDKTVDCVLNIVLTHDGTKYAYDFDGEIHLGTLPESEAPILILTLSFTSDPSANVFFATYTHTTDQQSINLKQIVENLSSTVAAIIPEGLEIDLRDVLFVFNKSAEEKKFLFGLDLGTSINLSNLPLIGQEFPSDQTISVDDLQLLVASQALTQPEVAVFNKLLKVTKLPENQTTGGGDSSSANPAAAIPGGLTVSAKMKFGATEYALSLPLAGGVQPSVPGDKSAGTTKTQPSAGKPTTSTTTAAPVDRVKWFAVQKSFGPVHFERVGVQYQNGGLWFLLDASLSVAGLIITLDGLALGAELKKFAPQFNLHGLGVDYEGGGVEIGGAFLRVEGTGGKPDVYNGSAVIKAKAATISGLGSYSYAEPNGHPSLFVYAFLNYPLGGPAFFFITGLAAGFGYNRKLVVPAIEDVTNFPLVREALGLDKPEDLEAELRKLQEFVPPAIGEAFLAVGIRFTTFKLIDSFALLTIGFGSRVVFNILGLSTAIVPTPETGKEVTPLAEVQMAWKATFDPDEGFLGLSAQLTANSYILSRDCHLTGGFAFYSWFAGEHAGDFVQTMGGYHPAFNAPAHYPSVPRLQFNWKVTSNLTLKGDAYYALCGSALMAGGHLEATWESGDLNAWFKAGADFLIQWKPYHYDASIYVDVGVSYTFKINLLFTSIRVTISVDVGADLHIWGPDFSGHARVHLWIITFGISFGAGASQEPPAIDWPTFKASFLPAPVSEDGKMKENICSISVKDGLVRTMTHESAERWIINPKHFALLVNSAIPCSSANKGNEEIQQTNNQSVIITDGEPQPLKVTGAKFGIGAMAVTARELTSLLTITIKREGVLIEDDFTYTPILKRIPAGLWGESRTPDLNGEHFIEDALTGFEITPRKPPAAGETKPIDRHKLQFSTDPLDAAYHLKQFNAFEPPPDGPNKIVDTIKTNATRDELLASLGFAKEVVAVENMDAKVFLVTPRIGRIAN